MDDHEEGEYLSPTSSIKVKKPKASEKRQLSPGKPDSSSKSPSHPQSNEKQTKRIKLSLGKRKFIGCTPISEYSIQEKVGEGTFGEVYRAIHVKTAKEVALKKILNRAEQEGFPITAIREIKLLKNLHHPNVIDLIDMAYELSAEKQLANIYMVFSYMDHDMTGLLERKEIIFSLPQIKCYFSQLLQGLKYLHEHQVLHRDIKGSNVLLNNRGELRLTDFGLSRPLEEGRKEYTPGVYTRWYRPPELLLGSKQYGTSADMWGVGCLLAEMFIKRPLFPGDDDFEQIQHVSRVCGTPSSNTMNNFDTLPNAKKLHLPVYRRRVREHFEKLDPLAIDLVDKLLVLEPKKRLTVKEALDHSFFTTTPLPALPQSLPTYPSSHELDSQKATIPHPPHPTPHEHAAENLGKFSPFMPSGSTERKDAREENRHRDEPFDRKGPAGTVPSTHHLIDQPHSQTYHYTRHRDRRPSRDDDTYYGQYRHDDRFDQRGSQHDRYHHNQHYSQNVDNSSYYEGRDYQSERNYYLQRNLPEHRSKSRSPRSSHYHQSSREHTHRQNNSHSHHHSGYNDPFRRKQTDYRDL